MTFFFRQVLLLRDLRGITLYLMIYIYIYIIECVIHQFVSTLKKKYASHAPHNKMNFLAIDCIISNVTINYKEISVRSKNYCYEVTYAENIFNFKMRLKLTRPSLKWKERLFKDSFSQLIRTLRNSEVSFYIFANREGKLIRCIQRYNE